MTTMTDPKPILREIKLARTKIDHYKQWKNEPSEAKKLRSWKHRLNKALAAALGAGIAVPADPFAPPPPPPPPPTPAELHQAAIDEVKARYLFPQMVSPKTRAWAPWGESGWSAVDIKGVSHVWCRANRVDPRTGETIRTTAKVRRDRLFKRDPELKGKDKPTVKPDDVAMTVEPEEPAEGVSADPKPEPEPVKTLSPEEDAAAQAKLASLLDTIDDDSQDSDW